MSEFKVTEAYRPRPISFDGLREIAGWRIKMYTVTYGREALDRSCYEQGLELAREALPQPPVQARRPGRATLTQTSAPTAPWGWRPGVTASTSYSGSRSLGILHLRLGQDAGE